MSKALELINQERKRQSTHLSLIASENLTSANVRQALGSVFTDKYAEGYPSKRYYGGCEIVDEIENYTISLVKEIFGAEHANVQPYSGTPANMAVLLSVLKPGDKILSLNLPSGGHLSHGHFMSFAGKFYDIHHYDVDPVSGLLDYDEIEKRALDIKPQLMIAGGSAYPRIIDFRRFADIAEKIGAVTLADIAHISGLVAAGAHPNPVPFFDFVTSTTHKTLRGPRGGLVMCKSQFAETLDKTVFPMLQGGPHVNNIAALAVALEEAKTPEYVSYINQVVANAKILAETFGELGYRTISGGTDNHLMLIDLTSKNVTGKQAEKWLDTAGIIVNKNMIPADPRKALDPSGMRLGTPSATTRGMREDEMRQIARWIDEVITVQDESTIQRVRTEVESLLTQFPIPE